MRKFLFVLGLLAVAMVVALIAAPSEPKLSDKELASRAASTMLENCRPYLNDSRAYGDCMDTYTAAFVKGRREGRW